MTRPSFDSWALDGAQWSSLRAECTRRKVGAVLFSPDRRVIAQGYNGAAPGAPSCLEGACPRGLKTTTEVAPGSSYDTGPGSCIATHAEANALLWAGKEARGATLYITDDPCDGCWRLIRNAGVVRVVTPNGEHTP